MGKVIPMFKTDEITGLEIPNRPYKKEYIIMVEDKAMAVYPTWNQAVAHLPLYPDYTEILIV